MADSRLMDSEVVANLRSADSELDNLMNWLDEQTPRPGLENLGKRLAGISMDVDGLRSRISSNQDVYCRNILARTDAYELIAILWTPGQDTPVHDHRGSDCAFVILDGLSTETIYELDENGHAVPVSNRVYHPGEVCAADEPDIHRISNDTDSELLNLHVYTPPLGGFRIFEAAE